MNYPKGSRLTVGTYYTLTYSIVTMPYTLNVRPAEFKAEVVVADNEGVIIDTFEQDGDHDWALVNACLKRIITEYPT
jgi:hypothetical protein